MTIRLHIGAHKTATTEIQQAMRRVRGQFEDAGTSYMGPKGLRGDWVSLHQAMFKRDEAAREKAITRFRRWLRNHDHHVLSEENIIGTIHRRRLFGGDNLLYPNAVENIGLLRELMGNPQVELFLSVRDPAEFVTSAYGQVLREGVAMGIEDYVAGFDVPTLSWSDLVGRLRDCDGVTRLVCWRYEDYADLRPHILSMLLGPDLAAIVPAQETHNAGFSEAAYQQFLTWVMEDLDESFVDLLYRARAAFPKGPGDPGMRPLPADVYARSRLTYPQDIARLAAMDGVTFLTPDTASDAVGQGAAVHKPA